MKKPIRKLTWLVGVVAIVRRRLGDRRVGSPGEARAPIKAGGTLNVGWEQSFSFTDNFDPTGEYLGDAFGIIDNLLVRTLIGYDHTAGGPGNSSGRRTSRRRCRSRRTAARPTRSTSSRAWMFSPPVSRQVTSATTS